MKRTLLLVLSILLFAAALPVSEARAETEQTLAADRVLVCNPLPYDQKESKLFSGTFTVAGEDEEPTGAAPFTPGLHKTGRDRTIATKDANAQDFWVCTNLTTLAYDKLTFRLAAQSEHCSVWTLAEPTGTVFGDEELTAMAERFETTVYPSDAAHFGAFRDLGGDGRLNIVTYDMKNLSVCGFFDLYDLYTHEEIAVLDPDDADSYNCLPIINVNTRMAGSEAVILGTLAHEFQHLILQSAVLESPANAGRLGEELAPGVWLNEAFAMEAEELAFPGSVAEQGYVQAYGESQKVAYGMSLQNFDATGTDVGAYGQSYLFAEYLKALCGDTVFRSILDGWRAETDPARLTEAQAIAAQLSEEQKAAVGALCGYTESTERMLGSEAEILLSKLGIAFRLAILLQQEEGLYSLGGEQPAMPVYTGTGRDIEGGGALLLETKNGSFTVPADADSGLVWIGIRDGAVTEIRTVQEPEEGFYVIAAYYGGEWLALPAAPAEAGMIRPIGIEAPQDGTIFARDAKDAIFAVTKQDGGWRIACDDANGAYVLAPQAGNRQELAVAAADAVFARRHFADGTERLQANGRTGRAILYGGYQKAFGYYAPAWFSNDAYARPYLIRVRLKKADVNLDEKITAADAALILRSVAGLNYLNAPKRAAADLDGDGEATAADAARVLRVVVQLEPEPEEEVLP